MKRTAALRVTGDICFYFSILSLFPAFKPWELPMGGFVLACLVVGLIAVGLQSMPLRLVLSLLPGACFLFAQLHPLLILPGLAWLYFILYVVTGRFGIDLNDYRLAFRWMLIISAFVLVIQAINSMVFKGAVLSLSSLIYLLMFVLLGVIAMRIMQMGAPMDVRWHAANALTVAAVLFVSVSVSLVLYVLYRHSVPVLGFLFTPFRRLLAWLFGLIRVRSVTEAPQATAPVETQPIVFSKDSLMNSETELHAPDALQTTDLHRITEQAINIGAFLVIALLVFLLLWLIVKLIRRGKQFAEESVPYEQTEDFRPDRGQRRVRQEAVHGRAQTVRKIYREYLDYLKENGLQRTASDTSAEILAESARISKAAGAEEKTLRRIYLKARYSAAAVTDADVAEARECLSAIRGSAKDGTDGGDA